MPVCKACGRCKTGSEFYDRNRRCKACVLQQRATVVRYRVCRRCGASKKHTDFPRHKRDCMVCAGLADDDAAESESECEQGLPCKTDRDAGEGDGFPLRRFRWLVGDLKQRAILLDKKRFRVAGYRNDVDLDHCKAMWAEQEGRCALTGLAMTDVRGSAPSSARFRNVSIDRVDSARNYCKQNVQLVCTAVNRMKSTFSMEEFLDLARHVVSHAAAVKDASSQTA